MNPDAITARLAGAIETMDDALRYLDGDPNVIADLDAAICDLSELKREIEMERFRAVPA